MKKTRISDIARQVLELSPKLQSSIRQLVREQVSSDLSIPQIRILKNLGRDGELTNSQLAYRCDVEVTSMTRMIDVLVRRGLVNRARAESDRRCVRLQLAPAGRRLIAQVTREAQAAVARGLAHLGEADQRALAEGLRILARALESL